MAGRPQGRSEPAGGRAGAVSVVVPDRRGRGKRNPGGGAAVNCSCKKDAPRYTPPRCRNRPAAARRRAGSSPNHRVSQALLCAGFAGNRRRPPSWAEAHTPRIKRLLGRPLRGGFAVELCRTGGRASRPAPGESLRNDERGTMNDESVVSLIHRSSFRVHRLLTARSPGCPVRRCGCGCSRPAAGRRFCRRRSGRSPASGRRGRSPRRPPPRTPR